MRPFKVPLPLLLAVLGLFALGSCTKPESMGLYDPNEPQAPSPTITSISPAGLLILLLCLRIHRWQQQRHGRAESGRTASEQPVLYANKPARVLEAAGRTKFVVNPCRP